MFNIKKLNGYSHVLVVAALAITLGACAPRLHIRGNLPDPDLLAEITPGEHTRDEVAEILGSPSSTAVFDQETWYYISEKTETFAFFEPDVISRKVVILTFDKEGVVTGVKSLKAEDGRFIEPVDRITPTAGKEITFLDQLFGNLGRFRKSSAQ